MIRFVMCSMLVTGVVTVGACGSDPGGGGADGGGSSPCGFEDRYLPYQVGYSWGYQVTDLGSGERSDKNQEIMPEVDDPELGPVLVQRTEKSTGATVSYLVREDAAVIRLRQEDYDELDMLQRTTDYDPGQTRLDESSEHLAEGAMWDTPYAVTVYDETGTLVGTTDRIDSWEILGTGVECESPLGTFECLHVRRIRTVGGIADKQYWFARGVGKVKELGSNQLEELVSCSGG